SHVAIYLGKGLMLQAPQPGQNVEVVPVDLGSGFAGAVAVSPAGAAAAAGTPLGEPGITSSGGPVPWYRRRARGRGVDRPARPGHSAVAAGGGGGECRG